MTANNSYKCLIEGCKDKEPYSRGLCRNHYLLCMRAVQLKQRTWEELEKFGMCLPKAVKQSEATKLFKAHLTKVSNES